MAEAVRRLQRAASVSPEEKAIKQELQKAIQKRDQQKEKEKEMYQRMVGGKPARKGSSAAKTKLKQDTPTWVS